MFGSGIIILGFMTASVFFAQRGPTDAAKNKSSVFSEPTKPQHGEHEESL
jgi:hypothetical protein